MVRTALYEAANVMLTRAGRFSTLKRWALEVAKRRGDYREFRVWAGMLGAKEPGHATTQRAQDTRCAA